MNPRGFEKKQYIAAGALSRSFNKLEDAKEWARKQQGTFEISVQVKRVLGHINNRP